MCMCVAGLCVGVFVQRRQIKPVCYTGLQQNGCRKRHLIHDSPLKLDLTLATACPTKVDSRFKVELTNVVRDNHCAKHCITGKAQICVLYNVWTVRVT